MQTLTPVVSGGGNDHHVLLLATAHDLRQKWVYVAGFDQLTATDIDQMRAGLKRERYGARQILLAARSQVSTFSFAIDGNDDAAA